MRKSGFHEQGRLALLLLGAGAIAACAGMRDGPDAREAAALARDLEGRTAGPPETCVPIVQGQSLRVVDPQTLRYGGGRTIWVARLRDPCPGLRAMDSLIVEPMGNRYCRGDRIRGFSPSSPIPGPICAIDSFVPYTR